MILIDTQIVIWLAVAPAKISLRAAKSISAERKVGAVAISDKTLWEMAMLFAKKKTDPDLDMRETLEATEQSFMVLPINAAIAERSVQFKKNFPADPADRIIAATAIVYGLRLVTADALIRKSGEVDCIW
jgi:PIN domain nuclease of toxin-antitoxin system